MINYITNNSNNKNIPKTAIACSQICKQISLTVSKLYRNLIFPACKKLFIW